MYHIDNKPDRNYWKLNLLVMIFLTLKAGSQLRAEGTPHSTERDCVGLIQNSQNIMIKSVSIPDLGRFRIRSRNQRMNLNPNPDLIPDSESCVVESDLESESCRLELESDSDS